MDDKQTCEICETCDWWESTTARWCGLYDDYRREDEQCDEWRERIEDEPCEDGGCAL